MGRGSSQNNTAALPRFDITDIERTGLDASVPSSALFLAEVMLRIEPRPLAGSSIISGLLNAFLEEQVELHRCVEARTVGYLIRPNDLPIWESYADMRIRAFDEESASEQVKRVARAAADAGIQVELLSVVPSRDALAVR
jgi:hypothetical protein